MLEKQIIKDYHYILSRLERGYQEKLDNLVNELLILKYNLGCGITLNDIHNDEYLG